MTFVIPSHHQFLSPILFLIIAFICPFQYNPSLQVPAPYPPLPHKFDFYNNHFNEYALKTNVLILTFYRITDEVVVACKLLNGHLYKGKEIGREQMVLCVAFVYISVKYSLNRTFFQVLDLFKVLRVGSPCSQEHTLLNFCPEVP